MKSKFASVKNHIQTHRAKYSAAATFTACLAVHISIVGNWNEFLKENDLINQYYYLDEV